MGFRSNGHAGPPGVTTVGRPVDYIRDAADSGLYWVLSARPDGSWQLHQFDDGAGTFTEAVAVSPRLAEGEDSQRPGSGSAQRMARLAGRTGHALHR